MSRLDVYCLGGKGCWHGPIVAARPGLTRSEKDDETLIRKVRQVIKHGIQIG